MTMQTGEVIEFHLRFADCSAATCRGTIQDARDTRGDRPLDRVWARFVSASDEPLSHSVADILDTVDSDAMIAIAVDRARSNRLLTIGSYRGEV